MNTYLNVLGTVLKRMVQVNMKLQLQITQAPFIAPVYKKLHLKIINS